RNRPTRRRTAGHRPFALEARTRQCAAQPRARSRAGAFRSRESRRLAMTEPLRWIDANSDADGFERDVLRSARDVEVPERAADEVWHALLCVLPPGGMPGGGSAGSGATSAAEAAGLAGAVKGFVVGACAGAILMGG